MKFSNILKKINLKSHKSMLKTGAILFWTDMEGLFNWNMDNFKPNFLLRGQRGSKSNDKFFLSVLKMWQCCKYVFGNLIFALTARTLSGNRLNALEVTTPSPFQCRIRIRRWLQLKPNFVRFLTLHRGKGEEQGKVSQDLWCRLLFQAPNLLS